MRFHCLAVLAGTLGLGLELRAEPPLVEVAHKGTVQAVAWSSDGKVLATGAVDGTICLTEMPSGKEIRRFPTQGPVAGLAISPDGQLLGIKNDNGPFTIFSVNGQKTKTLGLSGYNANLLAFSTDGTTLIGSGPGEQLTWHHTRGGASASRSANRPAGSFAAVAPTGNATGWGQPSSVIQIHLVAPRQYKQLRVADPRALAFAPDDQTVAVGHGDKSIRLWDIASSNELRRFDGMTAPAAFLSFSGNGKVLAGVAAGDSMLRVWDAASGRMRRQVLTQNTAVAAFALAPDGRTLATASADKALVWNVARRDLGVLGPPVALPAKELESHWKDLAGGDYVKSEAAFKKLAAGGAEAIRFVHERIRTVAVPAVDWKRIDQLLRDLDAESYAVRQKAFVELAGHGELAEVPLRKLLERQPSLEVQHRAGKLLAKLKEPTLSPERLRALEGLDLLETLGTPDARRVLEDIARDALISRIRQEASEALLRLKQGETEKK